MEGKEFNVFTDYSYITFAISAVMTFVSVLIANPLLMVASSVLLFSSMDAIGYFHLVWGGNQAIPANNQQERLVSYRFIQTVFQALVSLILYTNAGIFHMLSFNLMWWFGVCDILYYVLLKQKFLVYKDMFWFWWTPVGILKSLGLIKEISGRTALIQALIGIVLGTLLLIL